MTTVAVEITLLGSPQVTRDGEPVAFDTRKAVALLAHLALAERPRSREALCELLWPNHDLDRARGALRRTLSTMRKAIGEERIDTAGDSIAVRQTPELELDVARFRELAAPGASAERLGEAVALFSGEFLEGFFLRDSAAFEHWQMTEGDALGRELASALRRLVEALAARGKYEAALPHATRWLELDPVHEPAHRELIRLYAWAGERGAALEQYRRCVRSLGEELGVAPLDETIALYEQVESGTLSAPAPAPAAAVAPPRPGRHSEAHQELPLVGRSEDLAALVEAHAGAEPHGALAVIEGEAGIGKTRLAAELIERAGGGGAVVLAARCHEDEAGVPYGPVIELLREAIRRQPSDAATGGAWSQSVDSRRLADASLLLPELAGLRDSVPDPAPLDAAGARTRLLEATTAVIAAACTGPVPGIVFLDDAHAADEATMEVISYLGRRLRDRPLLLLIAWRTEGMLPGHRLRRLAVDLERESRATIVTPARLDPVDVAELLRAAGLSAAGPEIDRRLYLESEGLPFFVTEYLAVLRSGGDPDELSLPREVRDLLDARLAPLEPVARQALGAAAVIGGTFDVDTLREVSGRSDEETVGALEGLMAQGLVREGGEPAPASSPAYDFSHQKLRALVYEGTSPARRQLLHRRAAGAIAKRDTRGEGAGLIARHLRRAGDHPEAAAQFRIAAERAASLHANAEAIEHLETALALGHPEVAELHERLGDMRTLRGDYGGALASFESAAAHAGPEGLGAIEHKLGEVHDRRGEWDRAEAHFVAALDATPDNLNGLRARIQADRGLSFHRAGNAERAAALTREALALAETAEDRRGEAQAHNLLGILARHAGDIDTAANRLERSLAVAEALGDDSAQAAALNNLALVSRDAGDRDAALQLTQRALERCARQGDRHREAALENNLADIHRAAGRLDESMAHLKRAVGIFSEVGGDEATRLPEIWKLVSW